jgi:RimJ/RimL family protein N-acetyltransferase
MPCARGRATTGCAAAVTGADVGARPGVTFEPILETRRLRLRGFHEGDLDSYARIMSDAETMRYVGTGTPLTREEAWRSLGYILGHWRIRGYGLWAVEERSSGDLVGRIGLYHPEGWPGLEVGWLVERKRWGEGFATEGGAASLAYAFEKVGAERVISVILPANAASIRVAEKLGERLEGHMQLQGKRVCIYAIGQAEWARRRAARGSVAY